MARRPSLQRSRLSLRAFFCQLQSMLRLCVLACSARGLSRAFDGACGARILGGRGNWAARCIFFQILKKNDGKSIVDIRLLNHKLHEFSRVGSGFAGEFLCRFYLRNDSVAPDLSPFGPTIGCSTSCPARHSVVVQMCSASKGSDVALQKPAVCWHGFSIQ